MMRRIAAVKLRDHRLETATGQKAQKKAWYHTMRFPIVSYKIFSTTDQTSLSLGTFPYAWLYLMNPRVLFHEMFCLSKHFHQRAWTVFHPAEGDWVCICRRMNYRRATHCFSCQRQKMQNARVYRKWSCEVCSTENSVLTRECWNCFHERHADWKEVQYEIRKPWKCIFFECRFRNPPWSFRCMRCKRPEVP